MIIIVLLSVVLCSLCISSIGGGYFYFNQEEKYKNATGCEGDSVVFDCDNGISDGTIKYGRWDNTICSHPTVNDSTKSEYIEKDLTPDSIEIQDYNSLFGDPIPGVYKHYDIKYRCKT